MKITCHNKDCKNIFEYNGKISWTVCPICSSKIPLQKDFKNYPEFQKHNYNRNSSSIKNRLRLWLIDHPDLNPYNFFQNSSDYSSKAGSRVNPYGIFRQITQNLRTLPDFIFFGGTRSGVMTLTKYVQEHPNIQTIRNIHFFEYVYANNIQWYKRHFPTKFYKKYYEMTNKQKLFVGESTGTYLFHNDVPKRIHQHIPKIKLIVMLRNPIKSCYSKYNHYRNEGLESSSFEDAIEMEFKRMEILEKNIKLKSNNPDLDNFVNFNYLRHGHYAEKLENWFSEFPREQILILTNDEFNSDMDNTLKTTFEFIGLPNFHVKNKIAHNVGKYLPMKESTKEMLIDYFKPHNQKLYKILGRDLNWEQI